MKEITTFRFGEVHFDDEGVVVRLFKNGMPVYTGVAMYCGSWRETLRRAVQDCVNFARSQRKERALKKRAEQAFDAEFRDKLEKAVQKWIAGGGKVVTSRVVGWLPSDNCKCPEGCLFEGDDVYFPNALAVKEKFGFSYDQHLDFQEAFDSGKDTETPESALGLLYRKRFGQ